MWFKAKKDMARLYRDEISRRLFATASGRPKGAKKLKKLTKGEKKGGRWLGWLFFWRARA